MVEKQEMSAMIPTEVKQRLEELGAVFETEASGYIPVKTPLRVPKILAYNVRETTGVIRKLKQDVIRNYVHRNIVTFNTVGIQGILRKVCTMYKDPEIRFRLVPIKVRNVTFHLFSGRITGEIVNKFENNSKEGQEGYYITWRWRTCPTDPDVYSWRNVPGSADLKPNWLHDAIEETTNRLISRVRQAAGKVVKNDYIEIKSSFETTGLLDVIWTLLQIFTSGRVTTRDGYDVTVTYEWKGQIQQRSYHVDARVVLPVEGNVNWAWD